jgi:peroxiredoxin Q/BCP
MPLIDAGVPAPAFTLRDQHGETHRLSDFHGRPLVLYFYPKDDTTVCTAQACRFRDAAHDFRSIKAGIVGVSPDDESSHASFARKHRLGFPLLADTEREADGTPRVCGSYGVWQAKSMYGRNYMGVVRTTYLIDGEGIVRHRWDRVKVPGHAESVLAAVKQFLGIGETGKPAKRSSEAKERRQKRTGGSAPKRPAKGSSRGRGTSAKTVRGKPRTGRKTR